MRVTEPDVDYNRVAGILQPWADTKVAPALGPRLCPPSPCVVTLSWNPAGEGAPDFQKELMGGLFEMGRGVGQPSVVTEEGEDGRVKAWVFWVSQQESPEAQRAFSEGATARIAADGGPQR